MELRKGFDEMAALAMLRSMGADDPTFIDRARRAPEFWGFYDPEPIGAAILTEHEIHIGVMRPGRVGFRVRRLVDEAMRSRRRLFAPIRIENRAAQRLALGCGFVCVAERAGYRLYGRLQWASSETR